MPRQAWRQAGEFVVTQNGVEGSLIYAAVGPLRDAIDAKGSATLYARPAAGRSAGAGCSAEMAHPRGSRSLSNHLQSRPASPA